jgi:hypothetical protein
MWKYPLLPLQVLGVDVGAPKRNPHSGNEVPFTLEASPHNRNPGAGLELLTYCTIISMNTVV